MKQKANIQPRNTTKPKVVSLGETNKQQMDKLLAKLSKKKREFKNQEYHE